MNNIKIIILLFIHLTTSFIPPPKINSLSLIKHKNFNINPLNKISMFNNNNNNNNNSNNNNKTKNYKIIFDFNNFNDDNYEDNQTIINKIIYYTILSISLYQTIIYYLLIN